MKKRIGRRLVSLLLTVVTILTMLPAMTLPALAATGKTVTGLRDATIELSFTGDVDNAWRAKDRQIIGHVKGKTNWIGKEFSYNSTLTITNNRLTKATLFFDYTIGKANGGAIQVTPTPTDSSTFSTELAPGAKTTVYISSGKGKDAYATITMTNVRLIYDTEATVTFQPAENGSYTVNKKMTITTKAYTNTQSSMTAYQVAAIPAEGYVFRDWYNVTTGKTISTEISCALNVDEKCEITARFVPDNTATFEAGDETFIALDEAIEYAKAKSIKKITVIKDGILLQGDYTIPAGITLLIPYDAAETVSNGDPELTKSYVAPSTFRELTMTDGSTLTVNGELVVGGQLSAAGTSDGYSGTPSGQHGAIIMPEGSAIIVNGKLYAYGYISGPKDSTGKYTSGFNCGTVTVNSGGEVHEALQIKDFRGGTVTALTMLNNKERVFLFSQYYVQNIEVPLTFCKGAHDYVYSGVNALGLKHETGQVSFIGSSGLFNITEGYITRTYVAKAPEGSALLSDHVYYDVYGSIEVNSINLKIAKYPIAARDYDLPINGNLSLRLFENESGGSKAVVNTPLALLPGFELYISKNSKLTAAAPMYVYDAAEWYQRRYVFSSKYYDGNSGLTYTKASKGTTPKQAPSAQIDVNGTLTTSTGGVYTTEHGANIYSSEGTGKFIQSNAPDSTKKTNQYVQAEDKFYDIPITPAKLKNADGKYTETKDAVAKDTFTYCTCPTCGGKWGKNLQVAAIINNGTQGDTYSTLEAAVKAYSPDNTTAPTNYIKLLHNTTEKPISVNNKSLYLDLNGRTVTGDISVTGTYKLSGMDSSTGTGYDTAPSGKIVGKVTGTVAPVFEKPLTGDAEYNYLRYVAIKNEEGTEYTFHRFNISVTGYRFELEAPQCALVFRGEFRGDEEAKKHLKSLGFTLKDGNDTVNDSREISQALADKFVEEDGDAYRFEFYLIRSFKKNPPANAYTDKFSATAQATFKNDETQNSETDETQNSDTKEWSFQEAWQNSSMTEKDKAILNNFFNEFGIKIQVK